MNRDNPFIANLKFNDKIKLVVDVFGQNFPFEGLYLRLDEKDDIYLQTKDKDDASHFPLKSVVSGIVIESTESVSTYNYSSDIYKNIDFDEPDFRGYYLFYCDKTSESNRFLYDEDLAVDLKDDIHKHSCDLIVRNIFLSEITTTFLKEDDVYILFDKVFDFCKQESSWKKFLSKEGCNIIDEFIKKHIIDKKLYIDTLSDYIFYAIELLFLVRRYIYSKERTSYMFSQVLTFLINSSFLVAIHFYDIKKEEGEFFKLITFFEHLDLLSGYLFNRKITDIYFSSLIENDNREKLEYYPSLISLVSLFSLLYYDLYLGDKKLFKEFYENDDENGSYLNFFGQNLKDKYNIDSCYFSGKTNSVLVFPLLTVDELLTTKRRLLSYLQACSLIDSQELFIRIKDKKLEKEFDDLLKNTYKLETTLSESLSIVYEQFENFKKNFMRRLLQINGISSILYYEKESEKYINELNIKTTELLSSIKNNGNKYLAVTEGYIHKINSYLTRMINITDYSGNIAFSEAEDSFLLSEKKCETLLAEDSNEIFSEVIKENLSLSNRYTHSSEFANLFYSKFVPEITVEVNKSYISSNSETGTLYIPIQISNAGKGQPIQISKLKVSAASGKCNKTNELVFREKIITPNSSLYHIAEIQFDVGCSCLDVEVSIDYKYKSSYDFDKDEFGYKTEQKTENLAIEEHFITDDNFHGIKNIFRDYCSGSVVKDSKMFFGRDNDIKNVINNIRDENNRLISNRCVCIYGQTRTGKSSLLYHIKKELQKCKDNIVVDLGDIGTVGSEAGFLYSILSHLAEEIEFEHKDIYDIIKTGSSYDFEPDFEKIKNSENYFTDQIRGIQRQLKKDSPQTQIILLIDEFTYIYDWIKQNKFSVDFMKFWKALMTNHDICALVVGQDHMMKFINDARFTNAFGVIRTWEVNYLDRENAYKLITKPLSNDKDYAGENSCSIMPDAVELLIDYTSGSAYLLMNICADFVDYLNERHATVATRAHVEDFVQRHLSEIEERWFEPLYNDKIELDSNDSITQNKNLLKKIANSITDNWVHVNSLDLSDNEKIRYKNLCERHVVEEKNGKCRIVVKLYSEWLRSR